MAARYILRAPDVLVVADNEDLASIAAPVAAPVSHAPQGVDVRSFVEKHLMHLGPREKPWKGGTLWTLDTCAFNVEHTNKSEYVILHASGAVSAGCHHAGCSDKDSRQL